VLKAFESGDLSLEHHIWKDNGFVKDLTPELNIRFSFPRTSASPTEKTILKGSGSSTS
jgi:hypothetical protein